MEEKNTSENEQNDRKSWLEEQLQKRNLNQSEDTFAFKDDKEAPSVQNTENVSVPSEYETSVVKNGLAESNKNSSHTEEITAHENTLLISEKANIEITKPENTEITKIEKKVSETVKNEVKETFISTQKDSANPKTSKLSLILNKKLFGQITVKKAVPYTLGGIVFIFLVFNIRYVVFNENKVPTLHSVNVKDTLLSDVSITKVLDPANPEKGDKKNPKKQEKPSNNNEKNDVKQNNDPVSQRAYYKVKQGDKFNDIARKHGLTPAELKELNPKVRPERIQPGQKLRVKKLD